MTPSEQPVGPSTLHGARTDSPVDPAGFEPVTAPEGHSGAPSAKQSESTGTAGTAPQEPVGHSSAVQRLKWALNPRRSSLPPGVRVIDPFATTIGETSAPAVSSPAGDANDQSSPPLAPLLSLEDRLLVCLAARGHRRMTQFIWEALFGRPTFAPNHSDREFVEALEAEIWGGAKGSSDAH